MQRKFLLGSALLLALTLAPVCHAATALSSKSDSGKKDSGGKKMVLFGSHQGPQPLTVNQERYLAFGQSIFNYYGDHRFHALSQLVINKKKGLFNSETDYASLLIGELYVAYGLPKPASRIFDKLLKKDILTQTRAETWLHKAELHYHENQLQKAKDILESNKVNGLASDLATERSLILANVLIDMKQFDAAQQVLANVPRKSPKRIYADYNIAVAMIRNGDDRKGLKLLSKVYKQPDGDKEHNAVRDRAALTAGLVSVKQKDYSKAIKALSRIGTKGPFSNDAMLILGLAFYNAGKIQKALPLWLALVNRNSADQSVQEALMLAPKAYEKLGALPQALRGYRYAARTYRDQLRKVESAILNMQKGTWLSSLLPSDDKIRQNPDPMSTVSAVQSKAGPETLYLYRLFSSRSFAQKFKEYQQIQRLGMLLQRWNNELGTLEDTFVQQKRYLKRKLPPIRKALSGLNRKQQQLNEKIMMLRVPQRLDMNHPESLASYPQLIMYRSVQRLENSPLAGSRRLQHIKGLLLWDIAHDAEKNRKQQDQDKSQLVADGQMLNLRIKAAKQLVEDANQHIHSNLDQKFAAKQNRLDKLLADDHKTLKELQQSMESEAITVLAGIRSMLVSKLAEANLAEAHLQDKSISNH